MKRTMIVGMMALGLVVPAVAWDPYEANQDRIDQMDRWLHEQRMETETRLLREAVERQAFDDDRELRELREIKRELRYRDLDWE